MICSSQKPDRSAEAIAICAMAMVVVVGGVLGGIPLVSKRIALGVGSSSPSLSICSSSERWSTSCALPPNKLLDEVRK